MIRKSYDQPLFNTMRRRVLRRRIPRSELVFACLFLPLLVVIATWLCSQKTHFDPADRDISVKALCQGDGQQPLYHTPLRRLGEGRGPAPLDIGGFPAALLDGGWALDGPVERYDPEDLYQKIDGAAELFLRFGFVRLEVLTLVRDGLYLSLEDYDQGDFRDAQGVFAAQQPPGCEVARRGGLFFCETSVGFVALQGRHYLKASGSEVAPGIDAKAAQFLDLLSEYAGSSATSQPAPEGGPR